MKAITEQSIRIALLRKELKPGDTVVVDATTVITPAAASYMREQQLHIARNNATNAITQPNQFSAMERQVKTIQIIDCFVELLEMCYMHQQTADDFFATLAKKLERVIKRMSSTGSEQSALKMNTDNEKIFSEIWTKLDFTTLGKETILYYRLLLKSSQVYLDLLCHDYNEVIVNETFDLVIYVINELEKKVNKT